MRVGFGVRHLLGPSFQQAFYTKLYIYIAHLAPLRHPYVTYVSYVTYVTHVTYVTYVKRRAKITRQKSVDTSAAKQPSKERGSKERALRALGTSNHARSQDATRPGRSGT